MTSLRLVADNPPPAKPPPPPNLGYGVLLADPPWRFVLHSDKGEEKSPQAHYACMDLGDLKALGADLMLDWIMAPHCVCVMWATFAMLPDGHGAAARLGLLGYVTGGAWRKTTTTGKTAFGTGYVYRSASEPWVLGMRGKPKIKSRSVRNWLQEGVPDLIEAERREHSRKPDEMHAIIEAEFDGPFLELFARQPRPGWQVWGNQTGKFEG